MDKTHSKILGIYSFVCIMCEKGMDSGKSGMSRNALWR